jgi:uncharacterized protein DUF4124
LIEIFDFKYTRFLPMKRSIGLSSILSKSLIFALLAWVAFQPDPAIAKIFKYKDENGKTHFTDDASKIPLQYRSKGSLKKFKGVTEPTPTTNVPDQKGASKKGADKSSKKDKAVGLTPKDIALVQKAIQVFKAGMTLGNRYKDAQPNFSNGRGAVNAIQGALPLKESTANELEGTKVPELQAALGFLKQSIAADRETISIGSGLKKRIAGIFSRLASESEQQSGLIKKMEQALKNSKKKKAEAKKKKEEEAKKKKVEAEKKAEEAQKKSEEAEN